MKKNIELKIYELLGVKLFRKLAFKLRDKIAILFTFKMSKEQRKYFLYHTPSNYNIGNVNSLEDIKKFKKSLFKNANIHIFGFLVCVPNLLKIIAGASSLGFTIFYLILIVLNLYCIMLQRYNCIRINQLIKKMEPRYEKQKDRVKEELKEDNEISNNLTHKIINEKDKEVVINFEVFLQTATLKQLKDYKKLLQYFKDNMTNFHQNDDSWQRSISLENGKILKLEINTNQSTKI